MKITVVSGSTRKGSQSAKVAKVLIGKLEKMNAEVDLVDLFEAKLPIYDDTDRPEWKPISEKLTSADGFVWVVPEWSGTAGPGIMNMVPYIDIHGQIAHKPVLLVSVSSGAGGSYPLAQVKGFGAKNTRAVFVPESLRFRNVEKVFNSDQPDPKDKIDQGLHQRSEYALKILIKYIEALAKVRNSGAIDLKTYPSGL